MTAAIAVTNYADSATASATNANALSPVTNLQSEHVGVTFRYDGITLQADFDLGASYSIDTFALMGVSGVAPTFHVLWSATASPDAYTDSGALSGTPYFDKRYKKFVYLRSPVTARYVRFTQTEAAVSYTEWGRACVALRTAFGTSFQLPHARVPVRESVYTRGAGGATFVDRRKGTWRQTMTFAFLSEAERTGVVEDLAVAHVNEGHRDFLWIPDTSSSNLAQSCIWGFQVPGEMPVSRVLYVDPAAPLYTLELQVEDRG